MKPIFGTNWKMRNAGRQSARAYANALSAASELQLLQMLFVMPPATLIRDMVEAASDPKLMIGAQTFHWAEEGEFTGELSTSLLKQEGARVVLVGHAERRLLFGETDEIINAKIRRAFADDFWVVLCLGDTKQHGDRSAVKDLLCRQLLAALADLSAEWFHRLILAYEPIWAIGTTSKSAASPDRVASGVEAIREGLESFLPGPRVPILYGGSVNLGNCFDLMSYSGIDGLFVGRAASVPENFLAIVRKSLGITPQSVARE
jgi:triosephosphate isomerase